MPLPDKDPECPYKVVLFPNGYAMIRFFDTPSEEKQWIAESEAIASYTKEEFEYFHKKIMRRFVDMGLEESNAH